MIRYMGKLEQFVKEEFTGVLFWSSKQKKPHFPLNFCVLFFWSKIETIKSPHTCSSWQPQIVFYLITTSSPFICISRHKNSAYLTTKKMILIKKPYMEHSPGSSSTITPPLWQHSSPSIFLFCQSSCNPPIFAKNCDKRHTISSSPHHLHSSPLTPPHHSLPISS